MNSKNKIIAMAYRSPYIDLLPKFSHPKRTPARPFQTFIPSFVNAASAGNLEYLQHVLARLGEAQVKILTTIAYQSRTAFHVACSFNRVEVMEFLFQFGIDIEGRCGKTGVTPLFCAVARQSAAATEWLLTKGAKKNTPTKLGKTPYDLAVRRSLTDMLSILDTY
jgi:ankyrin repeat protein